MKILHLVDSAGFYGAETVIITLALEQKTSNEVPVVCALIKKNQADPDIVIKARAYGLNAVALPVSGNIWRQSKLIVDYAKSKSFDIIHSHGYRPGILVGLVIGLSAISKVRTLHGWTHSTYFSKLFIYNFIDALLLWRQDAVVVVSNKMKKNILMRFVPKSLISTIHNGISTDSHPLITLEELNDPKFQKLYMSNYLIGAVGRLSAEKAQSDLIRAVALLRKEDYQVAIVIIGEGPERQSLERLSSELKISDFVYLPGYLDNAARYLHLFRVLCIASLTEGLPITILEAMQHGVPVLSTNVGDIPELLENGRGFLVSPRHPEEIAMCIKEMINDPEKTRTMSEQAKQYFTKNYTSKTMVRMYSDVYKRVIDKKVYSQ